MASLKAARPAGVAAAPSKEPAKVGEGPVKLPPASKQAPKKPEKPREPKKKARSGKPSTTKT
ncbi:hypothetical protein BHE74_00018109 [Ensete ventricosum]|uniref:Uncharacterized protein n=1 Tax=Ensete ventricosum TaxID=4639 RepID=A0A426Y8U3_ENSVE|nr:hypothetical protein B296_00045206 [Ensete ventricosum]RWW07816.1 hypothetical protein GW17_00028776 [Ensete ventricosum]RWW73973.1 hypothetical protein BHE74_00018109 [Ensete ventricosum]RZS00336.1 hypothetical protein BHM03_00030027 [Ensete ventricosum]